MLNKSKGNMYPWVTHTWNVIKGKCPHDCSYCYMERYSQPELHFDEKELKTNLGSGNFIFVGSSCDMWADAVPDRWIREVLNHCMNYSKNKYLFQSKNPAKFITNRPLLPPFATILGTTIETNHWVDGIMGKTPSPAIRYRSMEILNYPHMMVSIEPIMDFDLDVMVKWMQEIKPQFVSIGANTNFKVKLLEPSSDKVKALIETLKEFTEVKVKDNLKRLLNYAGRDK